jgi:hypothetical protein
MAIVCPNFSHPDWIALEKSVGRKRALEMYAENNFEIPKVNTELKKTVFGFVSGIFKQATTLDLLKNNPELGKRIVDRLKKLYPSVRIYQDGLFDENGNWVQIPPGQVGVHYRNAFYSAVAWANDSYTETPPHEYAHEYIDMFRNHPLVQKGINKYGEEALVTFMGRYFAGKEMSTPVMNWINDFFYLVKSLFGATDIQEELARAFYKGQKLEAHENAGSGIYSFQEKQGPYRDIKGTMVNEHGFSEKAIESLSEGAAAQMIIKNEIGPNALNPMAPPSGDQVKDGLRNLFDKIIGIDRASDNDYLNLAVLPLQKIQDAKKILQTLSSADKIGQKLFGEEVELTEEEQMVYDLAVNGKQRLEYKKIADNSIFTEENNTVDLEDYKKAVDAEIKKTANRRNELYEKVPKRMRNLMKNAEKLLHYQLVPRVVVKYLSGSENSALSNLVYKALNEANRKRMHLLQKFDDIYHAQKGTFKNWSAFNNPKDSIDDYDTFTVKGYKSGEPSNPIEIKLTEAEALTMYLMDRQNDKTAGNPPPSISLRNKGFHLTAINDRDIKGTDTMMLMPNELAKLKEHIESDPKFTDTVTKIDEALEMLYQETNKSHKLATGFDIPKINNYFPVYYGSKSLDMATSKNMVDEIRSAHVRLGADEAIRIEDVNKIISFHKNNSALYASHVLPISNINKVMKNMNREYEGTQEATYINDINALVNQIQDNSTLFSGQGEKDLNKMINKVTGNFAVSVLAMNIATMLKQPVGYLALKTQINTKYLKQAGWGIGGIVGIKPGQIMRSIKYTGIKGGETLMPVEWNMDKSDPVYNELKKYSPILSFRVEGALSRETGEALMDEQRGEDKIRIPMLGITISKHRLMEGIKIMDSAVILAAWKAVKLETADTHPDLKEGSPEYYEHVARRTEEIIAKTQSAYELVNRSSLSRLSNPVARLVTMFGSQSSLMGNLLVDSTVSYINNPSKENKRKMYKTYVNIAVLTSLALATIEGLKHGLTHGFDDDDELPEQLLTSSLINAFGNIYGLSQLSRLVVSRMDSQPWMAQTQMPIETLVDTFAGGLYDVLRGYKLDRHGNYEQLTIDDGLLKIAKAWFMAKGLPLSPFKDTSAMLENVMGD